MTGSFARNMERRGLASSSSLSARDSATAYQACRQASRGGHDWGGRVETSQSKERAEVKNKKFFSSVPQFKFSRFIGQNPAYGRH